jgi:pimeloyl-ACP methyl ester carboxylesterase
VHIKINNCNLFFDVYGSKLKITSDKVIEKPTLIVLHGGHGMVDHTLYVEFLCRTVGIKKPIVAGISMDGHVMCEYAAC